MVEIHDSFTEAMIITRLRQLDAALANGDSEMFDLTFGEFKALLGERGAEMLVIKRHLKLFPEIDVSPVQQRQD